MSLPQIADLIAAKMVSMAPPTTPPHYFGGTYLSTDRSGPAIIYVPRGERMVGAGQGADGVSDPRPLFIREVTIAAHIWERDVDRAEKVMGLLVQAMHDLMWGSYKVTSGQWATAVDWVEPGFEALSANPPSPVIYTLNMEWSIPITRKADTFAVVSAMPLDPLTVATS